MLTIDPSGKSVLKFFISRIPENKKIVIDQYLEKHMLNIRKELDIVAEYEPYGNNMFMVSLKLKDGENTLIDIRLPAKDNTEARKLCSKWKDNYKEFYETIKNMFYQEK